MTRTLTDAAPDAAGKLRTAPVTWEEMVADPVSGQARILSNQIADRDEEIERLRAVLNYVADMTYCGVDAEWHFKPGYDPQTVLAALAGKEGT